MTAKAGGPNRRGGMLDSANEQGERDLLAQAIVDTFTEALVVLDETGQIVLCNQAVLALFGYTGTDVQGKSLGFLIDESPYAELETAVQRLCRDLSAANQSRASSVTLASVAVHSSGETFPVMVTLSGRCTATSTVVSVALCASLDKEDDPEMLQKELAWANEDLTSFAYAVSHDLKAPLRGIKTVTQWLEADCAEQLGDKGQEYLRIINGRVDRMFTLIQGVLDFSRIGRVHEELAKLDLNDLVTQVEDELQVPDDVMISIENELPSLWFEPIRMRQVWGNLLTNAIQFRDKSPTFIKVGCQDQGEVWTFSVADNGPGIAPQHCEQVFRIFRTLNSRERHDSAGMGLAIVKKILCLYGGEVWVESEVGKGSTFFFNLPKTAYRTLPSTSVLDTTS